MKMTERHFLRCKKQGVQPLLPMDANVLITRDDACWLDLLLLRSERNSAGNQPSGNYEIMDTQALQHIATILPVI